MQADHADAFLPEHFQQRSKPVALEASEALAPSMGIAIARGAAQLVQYDGQNGNPAYIAIGGKVYDVTNVPEWSGGKHNGYSAGKDLSAAFPHPASRLDGIPVVGTYVG